MIGSDPVFSVGEFVAVFNQSVEMLYPRVGIVGELANFKISRGQWVYFDLKDEDSQAKFFGSSRQLSGPIEDGMLLEVFGRPRLHPKYGFSIVIESIRPVGKGSIKKAQDLLAQKLQAEGLFELSRKRPLPRVPQNIGLIAAQSSAACADFLKIIDERWGNISIKLIDVLVQGQGSPRQLIDALDTLNELANPPEVIVLIRGGGSPEDLASFSDEAVVRAVAASRIPTLVAIGHEVDVSLAELAADERASTPSNAAERLVPDAGHEKQLLGLHKAAIRDAVSKIAGQSLHKLDEDRKLVDRLVENIINNAVNDFSQMKQLVSILDPASPLRRGFALVRNNNGSLVRSIHDVAAGDVLDISVSDGTIKSKIEGRNNGKKDN